MKKQKKLQNLIREVINLIIKFFKPFGLQDKMLETPKNVRKMGFKLGFMNLGMTMLTLTFAFLLKLTNMMIQYKLILIGIILFMLYKGGQVAREVFYLFQSSEDKKFELIFEDEIVFRGGQIIGRVSDKVLKFDPINNLYKVMSNEEVLNSIKNYLQNMWRQKIQHIFDVLQIVSVIIMLVVAIITNTAIPQEIFIPLILCFSILSFLTSAYISLNRKEYYKRHREYDNEQSQIINDLLRVPVMTKGDLKMRMSKLQASIASSNNNVERFHKKLNLSRLISTILETFTQYGIIIFCLLNVEWNSISLATITEITATLAIVETAILYIGRISDTLNDHNERLIIMEKEEEDISLILEVYNKETERVSEPKVIDTLRINPFSIRYLEESENDKPFTLISKNDIIIKKGEIVILEGASGSGKSTFMKMLTERIKLEKDTEIPSTSRFLFYDEKLKFGTLSIFEELFCCDPSPDLSKMQEILENLHLWEEIKSNCIDIWKWMKEKKFGQTLSNGQNQRLILAKMLYWMDDDIDVVVLDECTSGLDDKSDCDGADAETILEFITRYCNKDKKRIVIISTHQNIDGFKQKLGNSYKFKNLKFMREGEYNLVKS